MKLWKNKKINLGGGYFSNKKKIVIPLLIILGIVIIGTSFALWQLTFTQSGTNVITTGCLKLTLTEETDAINLVDATPISDEEGKSLEPFTFTLENVCTTETAYVVNLETLSTGDKILSDNYLRANLVSGDSELFIDNLLSKHINEEKVIEEASVAYKLHQGKLGNKEKISFSLRLWMDEDTEAVEEVMNATWQGKITVTATYIPPVKNLMIEMSMPYVEDEGIDFYMENTTYSQNDKYSVLKVIYQSKMNPIEDATEVVDFSDAQDKSVLGYYVKNTNDNYYTLYIQANGKIKVNPKASYYGFIRCTGRYGCDNNEGQIEGIENLDTTLVTDMSYMFYSNGNNTINLTGFDTRNVTDMSYMFAGVSPYESFKIETLNTSNVEDMSGMFHQASFENLDIRGWNTSKVTNMAGMFAYSIGNFEMNGIDTSNVVNMSRLFQSRADISNLDWSTINTSKVTNMSGMFNGYRGETLDLTGLDTSNVEDMSSMFCGLVNMVTLDISGLDTRSVTDMRSIFMSSRNLTTIIYGENFIHKDGASILNMFNSCSANKPTNYSWDGVTFEE